MLTNSFIFLEGITKQKEQLLWQAGVTSWEQFMLTTSIKRVSDEKKAIMNDSLRKAKKHFKINNHEYFKLNMPADEQWRVYEMIKDDCCYLDIETTGLDRNRNRITTICIYDGVHDEAVATFVRDQNLTSENLQNELDKFKAIVTFNGNMFDIPFMKAQLDVNFSKFVMMDLRWLCKKIGLTGGLKNIEKELRITRADEVDGMNGLQAVRLWKKWELTGNKEALDLLIQYNQEDVVNLKTILNYVYPKLKEHTLFQ